MGAVLLAASVAALAASPSAVLMAHGSPTNPVEERWEFAAAGKGVVLTARRWSRLDPAQVEVRRADDVSCRALQPRLLGLRSAVRAPAPRVQPPVDSTEYRLEVAPGARIGGLRGPLTARAGETSALGAWVRRTDEALSRCWRS